MIKVKIITPNALVSETDAFMVTIPAEEGEMGVLQGHSNMVVSINEGILSVYATENLAVKFTISSGFAEISSEEIVVLVESAELIYSQGVLK